MGQIKDLIEYLFNLVKVIIIVQTWEQGVRVRAGKHTKKLTAGVYFRIPYFDAIYIQETRLRVSNMPLQTLTTKDGHTLTVNSALGYSIHDIEKLYSTLYHPEGTIISLCMSSLSEYVFKTIMAELKPEVIEQYVLDILRQTDYGLIYEFYKLTNFANVKTFRLIQDNQTWMDNGISVDKKS